ncbi:hypothetical protein GCM10027413_01450 [Conyzicola nivalis]|uniref:Uncharacterized protein n=1 Tax=Conyzicola nivalis TaxID=1477021 RepID=A0A916WLK6_9MICO|nr:hypothetical protein GCM10010979_25190 [Conyzicola nivalis]
MPDGREQVGYVCLQQGIETDEVADERGAGRTDGGHAPTVRSLSLSKGLTGRAPFDKLRDRRSSGTGRVD